MAHIDTRTHISQVGTVFVPVAEQDRALAFYLGKLGFEKRGDFAYGEGARWVEVAPPGSAIAIALVPPSEGGTPGGDQTCCALATDDIEADHETLRARGVDVDAEVAREGRARNANASRSVSAMRSALYLPLFDPLADPALVTRLAVEAEEAGWDGVFVWDHIRWHEPVVEVADPWITLAAVATATERIRLGPMVTPLARRRPVKVARETATLDRLSGGRLTFGVGLGSDEFGREYSMTGEEVDDRRRAHMLDESLEILTAAWSGEPVHHRGEHYTVDGMRFLPRPVQRPGVPVWVAGFYGKPRPLRRAARFQGFFPVNLEHPDQLAEMVADLAALRGDPKEPYDVVAALAPGTDPAPYAAAGATWWVVDIPGETVSVDQVRGVLRDGPAAT